MKKITLLAVAVMALIAVGCTSKKSTIADLKGQWNITQVNGQTMTDPELLLSFDPSAGTVFGYTGCNNYNARFDTDKKPGDIEFDDPISTLMSCPDTDQELVIMQALDNVEHFKVSEDNEMATFYDDDNLVVLVLKRASDDLPDIRQDSEPTEAASNPEGAIIACGEIYEGSIEGAWTLEQLAGQEINSEGERPFMEVDLKAGSVSGHLGCNTFNANIKEEDKGHIDIDDIVSTRMACDNMDVEHAFAEMLDKVDHYGVNGEGKLVLLEDNAALAIFSPKK